MVLTVNYDARGAGTVGAEGEGKWEGPEVGKIDQESRQKVKNKSE